VISLPRCEIARSGATRNYTSLLRAIQCAMTRATVTGNQRDWGGRRRLKRERTYKAKLRPIYDVFLSVSFSGRNLMTANNGLVFFTNPEPAIPHTSEWSSRGQNLGCWAERATPPFAPRLPLSTPSRLIFDSDRLVASRSLNIPTLPSNAALRGYSVRLYTRASSLSLNITSHLEMRHPSPAEQIVRDK
jgi:hypothetical protein